MPGAGAACTDLVGDWRFNEGIGNTAFDLPKLKILQEVVTLGVFVPFAVFYMKQPVKLDFLWAGLCLVGAIYFVFRS